MLPAEAASRAAAREQFRHDVTRLWRGLLDAQQGDVAVSRLNERLAVWRQHVWRHKQGKLTADCVTVKCR